MIYQTVTEQDFIRAFDDVGRADNFSPMARRVLFEYFDSLSDDLGEDIELDPIAICCEWAEYTEKELVREFGYLLECEGLDPVDKVETVLEEMGEIGTLLVVEHIEEPDTYLFCE